MSVITKPEERKTAGELANEALKDTSTYHSMDVANALCNDILREIWKCIDAHYNVIDEPEFFIVVVLANDCLIKNLKRRKFYAWPYLPKPRPNQSVFLYRKKDDDIQRLWVLPEAATMANLSEMHQVPEKWATMKLWSDAFFKGTFWHTIRNQHGINHLSEHEYLKLHREELIQAGCKEPTFDIIDPFDFGKAFGMEVVNPFKAEIPKLSAQGRRKAK